MNLVVFQIDRIKRYLWFTLAMVYRLFIPIKKGRVFCWSYYNKQYSCNPMYITDYILKNKFDEFEVVWAFNKNVDVSNIDKRVIIVYTRTLKYLYYLYSSEFVITNSRNDFYGGFFVKKTGQKYIMTWHGSTPIKMIEKDANLGRRFERRARRDSKMCDLMLSNSEWFTNIIRSAFWYNGEVLEKGLPRNDIFFDSDGIKEIRSNIYSRYNIDTTAKIVLYAPTFRVDDSPSHYQIDWAKVIPALEEKMRAPVVLFFRLHPNSLGCVDTSLLLQNDKIIDMCRYPDMQELLAVSDILITDYSSTMFEFGFLNKICFLYANDYDKYDRAFYFDLKNLPFPFAANEEELYTNIKSFNHADYLEKLKRLNVDYFKLKENGKASESFVKWMQEKTAS